MRHLFMSILAVVVAISSVGSIFEVLDFNQREKELSAVHNPRHDKVRVADFQLVTPLTPPAAGAQPGEPVQTVPGRDITVKARVEGVRELIVVAGRDEREPVHSENAKVTADGEVSLSMRLPEPNTVYVIRAYGIVRDKLIPGWQGGSYNNRPAVTADVALKVVAR